VIHAGDIVCGLGGGVRLVLHEPVASAPCERCGERADDVCFHLETPGGKEAAGGLCGPCLRELLRR
jgi:hypothetical protein